VAIPWKIAKFLTTFSTRTEARSIQLIRLRKQRMVELKTKPIKIQLICVSAALFTKLTYVVGVNFLNFCYEILTIL
jgi:hypothetical protein